MDSKGKRKKSKENLAERHHEIGLSRPSWRLMAMGQNPGHVVYTIKKQYFKIKDLGVAFSSAKGYRFGFDPNKENSWEKSTSILDRSITQQFLLGSNKHQGFPLFLFMFPFTTRDFLDF